MRERNTCRGVGEGERWINIENDNGEKRREGERWREMITRN